MNTVWYCCFTAAYTRSSQYIAHSWLVMHVVSCTVLWLITGDFNSFCTCVATINSNVSHRMHKLCSHRPPHSPVCWVYLDPQRHHWLHQVFQQKSSPLSIIISGLLLLVHIGYGIAILATQGMVMLVVLVFSSTSSSWSLQLVTPIPISSEAQKYNRQLKGRADANTNANLPKSFIALQWNDHAWGSLY